MSADTALAANTFDQLEIDWFTERLTSGALLTVKAAHRHANRVGAAAIVPSHILVAILERPGRRVRDFVEEQGTSLIWLADTALAGIGHLTSLHGPNLKKVISAAHEQARSNGHDRADDYCLLLAILKHGDSLSDRIMREAGMLNSPVGSQSAHTELPSNLTNLITANTAFSPRIGSTPAYTMPRRRPQWLRNLEALIRAIDLSPIFLAMLAAVVVFGVVLASGPSSGMVRFFTAGFIVSVWLASLCLHEFGHAAAAFMLGDRRVKDRGYLTLDVRRYSNPLLTFGLPLISIFAGRIPLPGGCVMIDPSSLDTPRSRRIVSIAGPAANLLVLIVLAIPLWLGLDQWSALGVAVAAAASTQASVLILTMLPVPPLDGWQFFSAGSSDSLRGQAAALGFFPMIALFMLFRTSPEIGDFFWAWVDALSALFNIDQGAAAWGWWMLSMH